MEGGEYDSERREDDVRSVEDVVMWVTDEVKRTYHEDSHRDEGLEDVEY